MTLDVGILVFSIVVLLFSVFVFLTVLRKHKAKDDGTDLLRQIQQHRIFTMVDTLQKAGRLHEVAGGRSLEEVYLDFLRETAPAFDGGIIAGSQPGTLYLLTQAQAMARLNRYQDEYAKEKGRIQVKLPRRVHRNGEGKAVS